MSTAPEPVPPDPREPALPRPGRVLLVGAGPGDPELLTLRAWRYLRQADVVLYDHLVAPEILCLLPVGAERIYVGKRRGDHTLAQPELHALMIGLARQGRTVVRLKSGDPLVFGRGGEELEALAQAGIRFEVVPGITAAIGAAAAAAIPLTHREHASAVTLVTGHVSEEGGELDWAALARPGQTVVVYMGLQGLEALCRRWIGHGRSPDTPAAVIQQATRPTQRVVTGTLATLAQRVHEAGLRAPTVIVVGEVLRVREAVCALLSPAEPVSTPGETP